MTDNVTTITSVENISLLDPDFETSLAQMEAIIDDYLNSDLGITMDIVTPTITGQGTKTHKPLACPYTDSLMTLEDIATHLGSDGWDISLRPYFPEVFGNGDTDSETGSLSIASSRALYPLTTTSHFEWPLGLDFDMAGKSPFSSVPPSLFEFSPAGDSGFMAPHELSSPDSSIVVPVPSTPRKPSRKSGAFVKGEDYGREGCEMGKCLGGIGGDDGDDDDDLRVLPRLLWKRDNVDEAKVVGDDPFL